jgi:signal transduction histidine kinase
VSQAATGEFDSTLIEIEGHLSGKHYGPNNTLVLDLDEGSQSFSAILNRGRGDSVFEYLKPNSRLQLRGICMSDPAYTNNLIPFALLLRSIDDVTILTGPPWWSAGHLASLAIGLLLFALVINFFYHRIEHWRLEAILEERERLAHEMHDTLAQSFAGIGFQLEAIRSGVPYELPSTHQQLNLASELVRHSHEEARRSIATLRPESHESGDLLKSLHLCAVRMVEGGTVQVSSESKGEVVPIHLRIADTLYRIGQEAIANSIRHAHPNRLTLTLEYAKNLVKLIVADDGDGYMQGKEPAGFGIRGMRKRAASISASLVITSALGVGTRVCVTTSLPPRVTVFSWPRFLWKYLRKRRLNVESGR